MLALARWAADYYHHPIGEVMQVLLPVSLRQGKTADSHELVVWRLTPTGRQADAAALKRAPKQRPCGNCSRIIRKAWTLSAWRICAALAAPLNSLIKRGWVEKIRRPAAHVSIHKRHGA